MWGIRMLIIESIAKMMQIQCIVGIFIILFLLIAIKKFRIMCFTIFSIYLFFIALFFTFNNFGIDTIRAYRMKRILIPEAYSSYKQDLQLMKTFRDKYWFSYYTYKNMDRFNEEFKYILNFIKEDNKKIKYIDLSKKVEKINMG
ncbi:hypothetical protein [Fusobacterium sp.]|uniref:hypothetical protein n=2 Tax=Fusobacterium sp. TaxID=68766 RepID=UPI00262659A2|nr:hypothetical protein [Fusobacterium sp.]